MSTEAAHEESVPAPDAGSVSTTDQRVDESTASQPFNSLFIAILGATTLVWIVLPLLLKFNGTYMLKTFEQLQLVLPRLTVIMLNISQHNGALYLIGALGLSGVLVSALTRNRTLAWFMLLLGVLLIGVAALAFQLPLMQMDNTIHMQDANQPIGP